MRLRAALISLEFGIPNPLITQAMSRVYYRKTLAVFFKELHYNLLPRQFRSQRRRV